MVQNDAIHASNTTAFATRKNRNRIEINACEASGYACDGAAPCGTCIRMRKMVCRREDEDERVERHL